MVWLTEFFGKTSGVGKIADIETQYKKLGSSFVILNYFEPVCTRSTVRRGAEINEQGGGEYEIEFNEIYQNMNVKYDGLPLTMNIPLFSTKIDHEKIMIRIELEI